MATISSISAKERAAAPSMEHQQEITEDMYRAQTQPTIQLRDDAQDFGVVAVARDSYDRKADIRRSIMAGADSARVLGIPEPGQSRVQRTLPITEEEISYAERVEAQQQALEFDQWMLSKFDLRDPANYELFIKKFPTYKARMKAHVDAKYDIMRKWTDISMNGLQSLDDAKFLYAVESGFITLPAGYQDYRSLTTDLSGNARRNTDISERGIFNLRRLVDPDASGRFGGFPVDNTAFQRGKRPITNLAGPDRTNARRGYAGGIFGGKDAGGDYSYIKSER